MSRYRISEQAQDDLHSIWDFIGIENDNPQAAQRQVDLIYEKFRLLAQSPLLGQLRESIRPNLRVFPAGNYVILYYPMDDGIEVIGVVHGSRDIPGLFQRGER